MKTENFDDAFREKMEGINTENYTHADVERVYDYVSSKRKESRNKKLVWWSVAAVNIGVIALLIGWNVNQTQQKNKLTATITTLNNEITTLKNTAQYTTHDTVFIAQNAMQASINNSIKTNSAANYDNTLTPSNPVIANSTPQQFYNNTTIIPQNNSVLHSNIATTTNHTSPTKNNASTVITTPTLITTNTSNNTTPQHANENNSITNNTVNNEVAQAIIIPITLVNTVDTAVTIQDSARIENELHNITTPAQTNVVATQTVTQKENNTIDKIELEKLKRCTNFTYQLGIGADAAPHQKAISALARMQFNSKWAAVVGYRTLVLKNEKFRDEKDFRNNKNKDFHTNYPKQMPDTSFASNIAIQNRIAQISLAGNYTLGLRNQYSLVFGVGTHLDVLGNTHIKYNNQPPTNMPNNKEIVNKVKEKTPVTVLNNAFATIGIQKEWKHIALQLSPLITTQITQVNYKKEPIQLGADVKLYYTF
ncbi:MAG: hypothetical protein ABL940_08625 [Bacteroidia bacterium]